MLDIVEFIFGLFSNKLITFGCFICIPIVYFLLSKASKISKYSTTGTFVFSTLSGLVYGGLFGSFLTGAMLAMASNDVTRYPIATQLNDIALAVLACGALVLPYFYWKARLKKGAIGFLFDGLYSLLYACVSLVVYIRLFDYLHYTFGS